MLYNDGRRVRMHLQLLVTVAVLAATTLAGRTARSMRAMEDSATGVADDAGTVQTQTQMQATDATAGTTAEEEGANAAQVTDSDQMTPPPLSAVQAFLWAPGHGTTATHLRVQLLSYIIFFTLLFVVFCLRMGLPERFCSASIVRLLPDSCLLLKMRQQHKGSDSRIEDVIGESKAGMKKPLLQRSEACETDALKPPSPKGAGVAKNGKHYQPSVQDWPVYRYGGLDAAMEAMNGKKRETVPVLVAGKKEPSALQGQPLTIPSSEISKMLLGAVYKKTIGKRTLLQ